VEATLVAVMSVTIKDSRGSSQGYGGVAAAAAAAGGGGGYTGGGAAVKLWRGVAVSPPTGVLPLHPALCECDTPVSSISSWASSIIVPPTK
jgi:hypothetical protein